MKVLKKKEEIRKKHYEAGGLIIISILGLAGLFMLIASGIFNIRTSKMLYEIIAQNGILIIFGAFFFIISIYCWISFYRNVIVDPKKETLYLSKNNKKTSVFLNKKGKKFVYDQCNKQENKYYYVLKTHDYIYEVLEESNENFGDTSPKEKKSYWLNFYSIAGNYEDILLLPIVYVVLLIGLLSIIMSKGFDKIFGIILSIGPLYVIIYDWIYKIKLKKSDYKPIDDSKLVMSFELFANIIRIIGSCAICIVLIVIFFMIKEFTSRLIFTPFLGCGLCNLGAVISQALGKEKLAKLFSKGYILMFLSYWFGFLVFWTIGIVKQEGSYVYALFSIPFWLAGFFMIYKFFIKKQ